MTEADARRIAGLLEERDELEALKKEFKTGRFFHICASDDEDTMYSSMTLPLAVGLAFVNEQLRLNKHKLRAMEVTL